MCNFIEIRIVNIYPSNRLSLSDRYIPVRIGILPIFGNLNYSKKCFTTLFISRNLWGKDIGNNNISQ